MIQEIELSDEHGNKYYLTWKGHTVRLDKHAIVWATKQGMLRLARAREAFLKSHVCENCKGKYKRIEDKETLRVVADMSKFVAETLGKDNYAKRNEQTGKNGEPLNVNIISYGNNNNPTQVPA